MRKVPWVLLIARLTCLAAWIVLGPWYAKSQVELFLAGMFFLVPNIGTIWMLYVAVRFEKHPLPFVLLAFIPYAFLWDYFERVRPGKHLTRESVP